MSKIVKSFLFILDRVYCFVRNNLCQEVFNIADSRKNIHGTIAYERYRGATEGAQKLYICTTNRGEIIDKRVIYTSKKRQR